jgi:tartrate-resistant acid phosphatase type 5
MAWALIPNLNLFQSSHAITFGHAAKTKKQAKTGLVSPVQKDLFTPNPSLKGQHRFAVIGDPGSGTQHQLSIAKQLAKTYDAAPFASVLVLGDNVYDEGEPWLFQDRIEKPYEPLFKAGVKFFPILGNHDVRKGFEEQQLQYWGAPRFYSVKVTPEVELFALDTTLYLPQYDECYTSRSDWALKQAEVQTQWFKAALKNSTSKYKLVMGHYPLYSSGMHSVKPESLLKLRAMLEPILVENNVDLYLAGHEHHYERSQPIKGILHVVSGAAGRLRDIFYKDNPTYPRVKALAKYHFMLFESRPEGLAYQALSKKGKTLDAGLILPKSKSLNQTA